MANRPTVAVLGGTFDRIHAGHLALLDAAFESASSVAIGLTTARYLSRHPKPGARTIRSFPQRRRSLLRLLHARYPGRSVAVLPLDDRFGGSLRPGVDILVVSEETREGARAVNRMRRGLHLRPLRVVVIPRVLGEDGRPIAGRRIREGAIDELGRRRVPWVVRATSNDPTLLELAHWGVRGAFPSLRTRWNGTVRPTIASGRTARTLALRWSSRVSKRTDLNLAIVRLRAGRTFLSVDTPDGPLARGYLAASSGPRALAEIVQLLRSGRPAEYDHRRT